MKNSPYVKAMEYLQLELHKLFEEKYLTEAEFYEAFEGLDELPAPEVMKMYKAWKDSDL